MNIEYYIHMLPTMCFFNFGESLQLVEIFFRKRKEKKKKGDF